LNLKFASRVRRAKTSTVWPCTCENNGKTKDTMKGNRMQNEMKKRPVEQPRTKLFSLVMEHTEKRGKSGQDTEKERDWRHLVQWPV
jgi:hypothetical protein